MNDLWMIQMIHDHPIMYRQTFLTAVGLSSIGLLAKLIYWSMDPTVAIFIGLFSWPIVAPVVHYFGIQQLQKCVPNYNFQQYNYYLDELNSRYDATNAIKLITCNDCAATVELNLAIHTKHYQSFWYQRHHCEIKRVLTNIPILTANELRNSKPMPLTIQITNRRHQTIKIVTNLQIPKSDRDLNRK